MFSREFIDGFLVSYNDQEKRLIHKDLEHMQDYCFYNVKPLERLEYVGTAGGPGSAKSTTLEHYIKANKLTNYVYIDPDQVTLKNMIFTYRQSLTNLDFALADSNRDAFKNAYQKWRYASNYVTNQITNIATGANGTKYCIAHGTTGTSPNMDYVYKKLKALGYRIVLLLTYTDDQIRENAIKLRETEQGFVQTEPAEVISKGKDFCKRFDIYFKYADEIFFYWNNERMRHGVLPQACAHYLRDNDKVSLNVLIGKDWQSFCNKYYVDIQENNIKPCQAFEVLQSQLKNTSPLSVHGFHKSKETARQSDQPSEISRDVSRLMSGV